MLALALNRFHSDRERRFALVLKSAPFAAVLRWLRPAAGQFDIEYHGGRRYNPDFVLETADTKVVVEVKAHGEMADAEVHEKSRAARTWVRHATELAKEDGAKRWHYILLDEQQVSPTLTPSALLSA